MDTETSWSRSSSFFSDNINRTEHEDLRTSFSQSRLGKTRYIVTRFLGLEVCGPLAPLIGYLRFPTTLRRSVLRAIQLLNPPLEVNP